MRQIWSVLFGKSAIYINKISSFWYYFLIRVVKSIKDVDSTFRVLVLTGLRQVGKSTILKNEISENMKYVTLDYEVL